MTIPIIDEATRIALDSLSAEERVDGAYASEILGYGVAAVAHFHLMTRAMEVTEGKLPIGNFIKKYGLEFKWPIGFMGTLDGITADGVFIPKQRSLDENGRIVGYFDTDYGNIVSRQAWADKDYAWQLLDRLWQPSDFENRGIVEGGIRFGREMWQCCAARFNESKLPQNSRLNQLAERLVSYYSDIITPH